MVNNRAMVNIHVVDNTYRIAGKFGGVNVWQIDFYKLFGEWFVNQKNNYCAERRFVLCAMIK